MDALLKNKERILDIKHKVNRLDDSLFEHDVINNNEINNDTISIVMAASNRSAQTYFTLSTISNSTYKNIQIIIIDDSDIDPINRDVLIDKNYPFYIDIIKIKRDDKEWHNPLVNYNIGFQFIKGGRIVIQNAEVCHVGDVLQFINMKGLEDNSYYVFDVKSSLNYDTNEIIYKTNNNDIDIYHEKLFGSWYQSEQNNRKYHFLTALTVDTFSKIQNFSYDYTMGSSYDDDDFVLKIISKQINIRNIFHNEYNVGGIHLFHGISTETWDKNIEMNDVLFNTKLKIYNTTNEYIEVTEMDELFDDNYNKLMCC